jgi:hypothetical protein
VVKVREGFTQRFGWGAYYASYGQDNAFGERKAWSVTAGYNLAGIAFEDGAIRGGPFFWSAAGTYSNALKTGFLDYHRAEAALEAGLRLGPDASLRVSLPFAYRAFPDAASPALVLYPATAAGLETRPGLAWEWKPFLISNGYKAVARAEAAGSVAWRPSGPAYASVEGLSSVSFGGASSGPVAALRIAGGADVAAGSGIPAYALFDLATDPDYAVRSGYDKRELFASSFASLTAELRYALPAIQVSPIIGLSLAPFVFADLASARYRAEDAPRTLAGYGAGIRVGFENPVFAYFSFSYGWNPQGAGGFAFLAAPAF